ncbi:uncharacterized protein LOC118648509 [Monomorium pharaonis]|uniref:uncharacterized protein LOC118646958 n=1 Tax=Monomorium pharaonis TaxID=307658 RepID=UPI001746EC1B|nr:uncharacterized protein LOC118646958 [Monomorium pharaonis]XP_036150726.1 uncharacterized protein LOC118648509 [Monomorium pharaonis]
MEEIHAPVHDNSPSIEHILRPISYTSWCMGVGIAHPQKCSKYVTIVIRIIHLMISTFYLIMFIHEYVMYRDIRLSVISITKSIHVINSIIYFITVYYYFYHGIRQYNWSELMDKIKELDRKIRKETHINDRPVKIMEAVAILMTFVCCPLIPIVIHLYYFMYYRIYFTHPLTPWLFYYMMARSLINSFFFDTVVYVLYYRYQTVNKMLGHLDKLSDTPLIALKIRRIRELHNDICDLIIKMNNTYGLYLLFCSANCFFLVTTKLYDAYLFMGQKRYDTTLLSYIDSTIYTMQFGLICWICTLARQEFDKTKIIMCAIALKYQSMKFDKRNDTRNQSNLEVRPPLEGADNEQNFDRSNSHDWNYVVMENLLGKFMAQDNVNNEINGFLIQLQHRRVSFMACEFFEMNNNLFCSFVGVIFTFLMIFIQFA